MDINDALRQRRSIRKFLPKEISPDTLRQIVELARLYPSGGNLQPVRFGIISAPEKRDAVFADLRWAMYLPEFSIEAHQRPTAYIVLLRDDRVKKHCDYDIGAASTSVMLAAVAQGLATCPIANFRRERLSALLQLETHYVPELVIALGYPAQESHVVPMTDSVKYTEDSDGNLLVPKWDTEKLLIYSE